MSGLENLGGENHHSRDISAAYQESNPKRLFSQMSHGGLTQEELNHLDSIMDNSEITEETKDELKKNIIETIAYQILLHEDFQGAEGEFFSEVAGFFQPEGKGESIFFNPDGIKNPFNSDTYNKYVLSEQHVKLLKKFNISESELVDALNKYNEDGSDEEVPALRSEYTRLLEKFYSLEIADADELSVEGMEKPKRINKNPSVMRYHQKQVLKVHPKLFRDKINTLTQRIKEIQEWNQKVEQLVAQKRVEDFARQEVLLETEVPVDSVAEVVEEATQNTETTKDLDTEYTLPLERQSSDMEAVAEEDVLVARQGPSKRNGPRRAAEENVEVVDAGETAEQTIIRPKLRPEQLDTEETTRPEPQEEAVSEKKEGAASSIRPQLRPEHVEPEITKEAKGEETPPVAEEVKKEVEEKESSLTLNNPIKIISWAEPDVNKLYAYPENITKSELVAALRGFKNERLSRLNHPESVQYAFTLQVAMSHILTGENSLGTIDGLWGRNSSRALIQVQKVLNEFDAANLKVDGKPGKNTVNALLSYLQ